MLLTSFLGSVACALDTPKRLQIYFIDVEGGQATLFVTAEGQSLLIDTGWPLNAGQDTGGLVTSSPVTATRDAERIVAVAHAAGLSKIDYVLITHYHEDHVGGAPQLAERIPIDTFIDHGENSEPDGQFTKEFWQAYQKLLSTGKYRHIVAKPGDILAIKGIRAEIVASDGAVLQKPLTGAGQPNPGCKDFNPTADKTENLHSVGTLVSFGKLRILDLGDLTADKEKELMCPVNRLGKVDIYIASHHGNEQSGSVALVHALAPRVAIVDNGQSKGGSPAALDIIKSSPGLEAIWQLHYSIESGDAHNAPLEFLANLRGVDTGNSLALTANPEGGFSVFNSRTKETKTYAPAH
jgi:beta-lactamase superfamily II metal-dependent hydrolase